MVDHRALIEGAPIGAVLYDRLLRVVECNARARELLGPAVMDALQRAPLAAAFEVGPLPSARQVAEPHGTSSAANAQGATRARDGGLAPESAAADAAERAWEGMIGGRVISVRVARSGDLGIAWITDLTSLAMAESARRHAEQRLAAYAGRTPLGVIDWNLPGEVVGWNDAASIIFGYTREEAMGRHARGLIVPEGPTRVSIRSTWRSLLEHSGGERSTNENLTKDGRRIVCDWWNSPLLDASGTVVGVASMVQDVTEHRAAEDALKRSEARFRALIERSPDGIAVVRAGVLLYANPALVTLLGYDSATDLVGRPMAEHLPAEDQDALEPGPDTASLQEHRLVRRDGTLVTVEIVSLATDYDGEPAVIALARDVSERKLMHARLLQADRMVSVGTLAAGVAHEINNPLAYLMANVDVVLRRKLPQIAERVQGDADLTARVALVAEMLGVAREGADRVRSIVRDLKTFSRTDEEKLQAVDVCRVLDASIGMVWNEIRHRARLVKAYDDVPLVGANEGRLGQVFLNLLVNATQALPVGQASANAITVRAFGENGAAIVEITDTGPGIPEAMLGRIFDPFFTTKPIGVGTGLGLWICQGIVNALGGAITARSAPGQGAIFRVTLPAHTSTSPSVPPKTEPPDTLRRRGRVLVVDDEPALGSAIHGELVSEHDVVFAASGREALHVLSADDSFDVILCDLLMPDVTGMDVFEQIGMNKPWLKDRFVFMTGGAFAGRAREFLDGLANELLEKPFDLRQVRDLVRARATG